MAKQDTINLPVGFVAYSNLETPRAFKQGDKPKYDLTVAWPVKDYEDKGNAEWVAVKRAIHQVAVDEWGDRVNQKRDGSSAYKVKFRYGCDNQKNPEQFKDYVMATLNSEFEIPVVRLTGGDPEKEEARVVRKGQRVIVQVRPKAYSASERGVTLYAQAVAIYDPEPDLQFNEDTSGGDSAGGAVSHFKGMGGANTTELKPEEPRRFDNREDDLADDSDLPF